MLSQWTYVHSDTGGANVSPTLNPTIQLEGVTSLVHQVSTGSPSAVGPIDIMAWGAGITDNTTLVRTCFKFLHPRYGVFAIMQGSVATTSICYAATFATDGTIALWKDTIANILSGVASPMTSVILPDGAPPSTTPPLVGTWAISLLCQYDSVNAATLLTVSTPASPISTPIVEAPGNFPLLAVASLTLVDPTPLTGGVNAGIFSAQTGSFAALTTLDDFDVTQIYIT